VDELLLCLIIRVERDLLRHARAFTHATLCVWLGLPDCTGHGTFLADRRTHTRHAVAAASPYLHTSPPHHTACPHALFRLDYYSATFFFSANAHHILKHRLRSLTIPTLPRYTTFPTHPDGPLRQPPAPALPNVDAARILILTLAHYPLHYCIYTHHRCCCLLGLLNDMLDWDSATTVRFSVGLFSLPFLVGLNG